MREKRYYQIGEKVFVVEERELGVIDKLQINPKENIYKAEITLSSGRKGIYELWEIDKHINEKTRDKPFDKAFYVAQKRLSKNSDIKANINSIQKSLDNLKLLSDRQEILYEMGDILK